MSGVVSNPAELLRRLRARDGIATPVSGDPAVSARARGVNPRSPATPAPGTSTGAAAGLRAEAPDSTRAGTVEVLSNGTRLHYCRDCGRLASWGFEVARYRGSEGTWYCFEHKGRADDHAK